MFHQIVVPRRNHVQGQGGRGTQLESWMIQSQMDQLWYNWDVHWFSWMLSLQTEEDRRLQFTPDRHREGAGSGRNYCCCSCTHHPFSSISSWLVCLQVVQRKVLKMVLDHRTKVHMEEPSSTAADSGETLVPVCPVGGSALTL